MRDPSDGRLTIFEGIVRAGSGVSPGDAHFDYRKFRTNPVVVINRKNWKKLRVFTPFLLYGQMFPE